MYGLPFQPNANPEPLTVAQNKPRSQKPQPPVTKKPKADFNLTWRQTWRQNQRQNTLQQLAMSKPFGRPNCSIVLLVAFVVMVSIKSSDLKPFSWKMNLWKATFYLVVVLRKRLTLTYLCWRFEGCSHFRSAGTFITHELKLLVVGGPSAPPYRIHPVEEEQISAGLHRPRWKILTFGGQVWDQTMTFEMTFSSVTTPGISSISGIRTPSAGIPENICQSTVHLSWTFYCIVFASHLSHLFAFELWSRDIFFIELCAVS